MTARIIPLPRKHRNGSRNSLRTAAREDHGAAQGRSRSPQGCGARSYAVGGNAGRTIEACRGDVVMADQPAPRGAVLQFEIDRQRVGSYPVDSTIGHEHRAPWKWRSLIHQALNDIFENGGTLVVVASKEKITAIQRPDAEEL